MQALFGEYIYVCIYVYVYKQYGCVYIYTYVYIPQTVLAQLRGSYLAFIVIPLCSRIAGGQPKYLSLKYLSPAGDSLCSRIAGGQPKYLILKYLSPAADCISGIWVTNPYIPQTVLAQLRGSYFASIVIPLCSRIAGGQPKYLSLKYLSPAADSLCSRIAGGQPKYLSLKYLSPAADSHVMSL